LKPNDFEGFANVRRQGDVQNARQRIGRLAYRKREIPVNCEVIILCRHLIAKKLSTFQESINFTIPRRVYSCKMQVAKKIS
jgi:hypothetical protein